MAEAASAASTAYRDDEVPRMGYRFGPEDDKFELCEEIGSGAAARVHVCRRLRTGEQFAAKVINMQRLKMLGETERENVMVKLKREIDILQRLNHDRIVNLQSVHQTPNGGTMFLVMELVRGGELFDQIVQNKSLQEAEAKHVFRQLLQGVGYMHTRNVIHRDLKPENILVVSCQELDGGGKRLEIKIADFGLSKMISDGSSMARTFVGTPQYWAPEVLDVQRSGGSYNQAADFWSLGAVLFVMLCGRYPFDGKRMPLEDQIRQAAFTMTHPAWQKVSEDAKDFVKRLLQVSPTQRMGLRECLDHPWLAPAAPLSLSPLPVLVTEVPGGPAPMATEPTATVLSESPSVPRSEGSVEVAPRQASVDKGVDIRLTPHSQQMQTLTHSQQMQAWRENKEEGVAAVSSETTAEQQSFFRLHELLNLQVSIAGALEMASLAFRHTDIDLSDEIRNTFQEARELFQHAAKVVNDYARVCQQVSTDVLCDLRLAIEEKEPALAVSLLAMVKDWVAEMKSKGEQIQGEYKGLQKSVHHLVQRAQRTKMGADQRLQGLAQAMQAEVNMSPRAQQQQLLALGPSPSIHSVPSTGGTPRACTPGGAASAAEAPAGAGEGALGPGHGTLALQPRMPLNPWTRHLFDQLNQSLSQSHGTDPAVGSQDKAGGDQQQSEAHETWKRDVLDLLFLAPGVLPITAPTAFGPGGASGPSGGASSSFSPPRRTAAEEAEGGAGEPLQGHDAGGDAAGPAARPPGVGHEAICLYTPMEVDTVSGEASPALHSSMKLLQALRELKRVDDILHESAAFWANMDGTVQKLAQMKEHTERLVGFASNSKALKQRFDQRLAEYEKFWDTLQRGCEMYYVENQAASKKMYQSVRQVSDAADQLDTQKAIRSVARF